LMLLKGGTGWGNYRVITFNVCGLENRIA